MITLNHRLAEAGVCSRRKAADIIRHGRVAVNGLVVKTPFTRVAPGDRVTLDGRRLNQGGHVYLALNKPPGYTCTLADPHADRKVIDLVPRSLGRLYPVGRLDRNSRGLLLLTNDGAFAQRLAHPSFQVEKEYEVVLSPACGPEALAMMTRGVSEGGETLRAVKTRLLSTGSGQTLAGIILTGGRKREIRRMARALNLRVLDLKRVRVGGITLSGLGEGEYRPLGPEEVRAAGKNPGSKHPETPRGQARRPKSDRPPGRAAPPRGRRR